MHDNLIYIAIIVAIVCILLKLLKITVNKIIEILLFLIILYIGIKVFKGDMSVLNTIINLKNIF